VWLWLEPKSPEWKQEASYFTNYDGREARRTLHTHRRGANNNAEKAGIKELPSKKEVPTKNLPLVSAMQSSKPFPNNERGVGF